ncbi:MerR family transcriptional regulator [Alysiella filiformis]|uniref:DNA-binding transcriptional regulator, MerR family n=1 Tax=Alysiella filiformis DSM 16848 TaxID=1120981 RepID=A0A286EDS6_9NEIS|nr:MerR family transcriptional regulator [Alysiella filiformis]QMT31706.1 MerR family transcriptional regulator [Alysiella filiformis]UBQ55283.1 MerR family transcriptional regulator [Alysiella filiformis DSM 16848]SOD69019.1 DNA-binding transcriptional regulator, MerR family [Alysiella filiformis DSM 16848]
MSKFFKIKQASEQTGVHLETIRYYEKQGLISPSHQQNGYRVFDEQTLAQLRFIKACRNIGFSLNNIKTLLHLQQNPTNQCNEVDELAKQHLVYLDEQITQLQEVKNFLMQFVGCENKTVDKCQIIQGIKEKE